MRRAGGIALAALGALALAAGCRGAPRIRAVSDVKVIGIADFTGRCPSDIKRDIARRIPSMAVEVGLIGGTADQPGKPILLRGEVVEFPSRGSLTTGSNWINAGPMSMQWIVMQEDGTQLGTTTVTADPREATHVSEDPFVYTQSRAVLLWLLGH